MRVERQRTVRADGMPPTAYSPHAAESTRLARDARSLHLIDLENLGRGPQCSGSWLAQALERFERVAEWAEHDHAVGAASHWMYKRVRFDLPLSLRLLPAGGGGDAADLRLISECDPAWTARRFSRVVIGSGDGGFVRLAELLREEGARTWAVSWSDAMSPLLAAAVDEVHYLDDWVCGHATRVRAA